MAMVLSSSVEIFIYLPYNNTVNKATNQMFLYDKFRQIST